MPWVGCAAATQIYLTCHTERAGLAPRPYPHDRITFQIYPPTTTQPSQSSDSVIAFIHTLQARLAACLHLETSFYQSSEPA